MYFISRRERERERERERRGASVDLYVYFFIPQGFLNYSIPAPASFQVDGGMRE